MDHPYRAGRFVEQTTGYKAFIPAPLPPDPPLTYYGELQSLLSDADRNIGRLDALASMLPNPDLFVAMYVRHEAVLSSQIEGTQSTLEDVLAFEADALQSDTPKDVEEVVNYVRRVGRLLITLMLCEEKALSRPLLYLSLFLKAHRAEYYDRLTAIRTQGHWEQWLMFFLRGVSTTALAATQTAKDIVALRDKHRHEVAKNAKALILLDHLFRYPTVSVNSVRKRMDCTFPTASKLIGDFASRGWLQEMTGHERNRVWRYQPYLELFHRETLDAMV